MASEEEKKNILDMLKKTRGSEEEKVSRPTKGDDEEFDLNLLINTGEVKKVIKDGNINAYFKTVPTQIIFEIDSETDIITTSVLSGNARRGLRYACASILGYGIKDSYVDLKGKTWKEKEEIFLKLPNVLVNKLLQLHSRFERDASLIFTPETVKNS